MSGGSASTLEQITVMVGLRGGSRRVRAVRGCVRARRAAFAVVAWRAWWDITDWLARDASRTQPPGGHGTPTAAVPSRRASAVRERIPSLAQVGLVATPSTPVRAGRRRSCSTTSAAESAPMASHAYRPPWEYEILVRAWDSSAATQPELRCGPTGYWVNKRPPGRTGPDRIAGPSSIACLPPVRASSARGRRGAQRGKPKRQPGPR
jgi:hypothetical protein